MTRILSRSVLGALLLAGVMGAAAPAVAISRLSATPAADPEDVHWRNEIAASYSRLDGVPYCSVVFQGRLVVGGLFTMAGGRAASHIAAWDGREWSPLGEGVSDSVLALTVFDDKLYAGGSFESAGGVPASHIACWDGSTWAPVGEGTVGAVRALTVFGNRLLAGGNLSAAGHVPDAVSAWDGHRWSPLGHGIAGRVNALTVYEGKVIAGGEFVVNGDTNTRNLASWQGETWTGLMEGLEVPVTAMTEFDHDLVVGGYMWFAVPWSTATRALLATWNGSSWRDMSDQVGPFECQALCTFGGRLVAGGDNFATCQGIPFLHSEVKTWDGASWSSLTDDAGASYTMVKTLAAFDDHLIAAGDLMTLNGVVVGRVGAWDGSRWSALGSPVHRFSRLVEYRDRLISEGHVTGIDEGSGGIMNTVSWDGAAWAPRDPHYAFFAGCVYAGWCPGPPCTIGDNEDGGTVASELVVYKDRLIVGGASEFRPVLAWDGSEASPLGDGLQGYLYGLIEYHDKLIAAGLLRLGNTQFGGLAAWDGESWTDPGMGPSGFWYSRPVMAVYDDRLVLESQHDSTQPLRTWDGSSWASLGSGPAASIGGLRALCVYDGRLIAAGDFITAGGVPATHLAAWNGSSWEPLGAGVNGRVLTLAVYQGMLVAGGEFTTAGGEPADHIAAWDGSAWRPLGSGTNGAVLRLTHFRNDLVVTGNFTIAGARTSPYLAVWSTERTIEAALDVKPGVVPNPVGVASGRGSEQAVVPATILGGPDFDVRDVEPGTVRLDGVSALRWNYGDVATPGDAVGDPCAQAGSGPDGREDLTLMFSRTDLVASLGAVEDTPPGHSAGAASEDVTGGSVPVRVEGTLKDGSRFEGSDCLRLVGSGVTSEKAEARTPRDLEFLGNFPNPFTLGTAISFYLPAATRVRLEVHDVQGRRVATLVDGLLDAGERSITWKAGPATAGVYYVRLEADGRVLTRRMLLLR